MNTRKLFSAALLTLFGLLAVYGIALAHTTVHAGKYDIEVGWVDEPPVVGQRNAVVVNVSDTTAASASVDISKLVVDVSYGGQTKTLQLQPLSEDTTNQYVAPILPAIPGQYTVQLRGALGDTAVNADVQPEEVVPADTLAFPNVQASSQAGFSLSTWVAAAALLEALVAHHDGKLDERMLKLVRMAASFAAACPFCIDMNSYEHEALGIGAEEVLALRGQLAPEGVPSFSARVRMALVTPCTSRTLGL